ncbi:MAG TPA: site-2 protease family protein [Terriglobales bacterium]|nr:site-2 protease family protein [Terriglobales bacterium]
MPDPSFSPPEQRALTDLQSSTGTLPNALHSFIAVPRQRHRYWLHLLLLLLTFFTTLVVGAKLEFNFRQGLPPFVSDADFFPIVWVLADLHRLLLGIPFSFTLMLILLAHEMGHYVYCVRYGVVATLPFFIPAPTPIGTLGAFIRIKSPMGSRRALFDIGIAGPIAGFVVAVVVMAASLVMSRPATHGATAGFLPHDFPLIFTFMHALLLRGPAGFVPLNGLLLHPGAIAAWVGMFATALNLLPGGQLDGGHIVYAISPRLHRWVSAATVLALIPTGLLLWRGWLLWAVLLLLSGMRHPQIGPGYRPLLGYGTNGANTPPRRSWRDLGAARLALAAVAGAMLAVTFMGIPINDEGIISREHVKLYLQQHGLSRFDVLPQ